MSSRGFALAQVLVWSMVVCLLCALILRARLAPALVVSRILGRIGHDLSGQGVLNRVSAVWLNGGLCSSDATLGVSCFGAGCSCSCLAASGGSVTASPAGEGMQACLLTVSP